MVVQISWATSPGAIIFDCLPAIDASIPALNECLIAKSSVWSVLDPPPANSASCNSDNSDGGTSKSKCTVRQQNKKGKNNAVVHQNITQRARSPQSATETADITQTRENGINSVTITQTIDQSLNMGPPDDPTQQQVASQTATVIQTAGSGNNSSDVQQTMLQAETAQSSASITQEQNKNSTAPDQDGSITQISTSGNNTSNLSHQLTQRQDGDNKACGAACTLSQSQGSVLGGQRGRGNQKTASSTSTFNKSIASQLENQTQRAASAAPAPPPVQVQHRPEG